MNNKYKYKIDNYGIIAFAVASLVLSIGAVGFSKVWTPLAKDIFYDVVICICASMFGPLMGSFTGFIGVIGSNVVSESAIAFGDAVTFAVLGAFVGSFADKYGIREGRFGAKQFIVWLLTDLMGAIAALFFVRPYFKYLVYDIDLFDSLKEDGMVAIICAFPVGILLTFLFFIISKYAKSGIKKRAGVS